VFHRLNDAHRLETKQHTRLLAETAKPLPADVKKAAQAGDEAPAQVGAARRRRPQGGAGRESAEALEAADATRARGPGAPPLDPESLL